MGVMYVWMCQQTGECGKYCKGLEAINKTSKVLYKCGPFTIYITHMQVQPSMHDINKVMTHLAIKVKHTAGYRNHFIELQLDGLAAVKKMAAVSQSGFITVTHTEMSFTATLSKCPQHPFQTSLALALFFFQTDTYFHS